MLDLISGAIEEAANLRVRAYPFHHSFDILLPQTFCKHLTSVCAFLPAPTAYVYPKVKVRIGDEDDRHWGSLLSLKDIQFLSIQDSLFPVKLLQDVSPSPSPKAKIPKSYVPSLILPETPTTPLSVRTESSGTDTKSNPDEEEDDRPHIRASSIPPPRAVLSSPQNDALFGSKNRVKPGKQRLSALKKQNSTQNSSHVPCKVMTRKAMDESPVVRSRKSKDQPPDNKSQLKEKKGPVADISSRRRPVVEWVN